MKIAIVGGVAGGATVASQIRRLNNDAEITIYERYDEVSYGACGMPYHISGEVSSRDKLLNLRPDDFLKRGIKVSLNSEVIGFDTTDNILNIIDLKTKKEYQESYDYLILSPGGSPKIIPVLKDVPQAFSIHKIQDLDALLSYIELHEIKEAVVVGTGYVGLEVTENLVERDMKVTVLQHDERIYKKVEADMNEVLYQTMSDKGVDLKLNAEIESIEGSELHLKNGQTIHAPLIISAIGIDPNTDFIKNTSVNITDAGLIPINEKGQTNIDNVYALGDAIETVYQHYPSLNVQSTLAWPAHRMAHIIANQLFGDSSIKHEGLLGTNIVKFFDYAVASLGLSEKEVKDIPHFVVNQKQKNKSGYMSTSVPISIKIYVEKNSGKILRAVVVGTEGVDKRIDVLASHIRLGGTAYDLINIEIAYAPPFSSPKDVINMVGYKALEKSKNQ